MDASVLGGTVNLGIRKAGKLEQGTSVLGLPNGNRTDIKEITLIGDKGFNLHFHIDKEMNFSVNTFTNLDRVVHPFQLKNGDYISLNVEHKIGGGVILLFPLCRNTGCTRLIMIIQFI